MISQSPHLDDALRRTHRASRLNDLLAACGFAAAIWLTLTLLAILLDAAFAFNSAVLISIDVLLIALLLTAIGWLARSWLGHRFNARRVARLIEERLGYHDSRLINAVDFARDADPGVSTGLRTMVLAEAQNSAAVVEPSAVIDRTRLRRSSKATLGAACVLLLALLLAPRMFGMVVPRYLYPEADLPPFTLLRFDIAAEPQRIYYGKPATIRATLRGPFIPEAADLVFLDGDKRDRIAMHRAEAGVFLLPIDRAERSLRFYIDTPHGRSYTQNLTVLPAPLFEKVTVRYDYPAYTGWPSIERGLDGSGLHALIGTRAALTVDSNVPLREGLLTMTTDSKLSESITVTLQPTPEDPRSVSASFDLNQSGHYTLALFGSDGSSSNDRPTGPITVVPDRAPSVQLMAPDLRTVAPEGWKVPVNIAASDDIGIGRVVLRHRVNDEPPSAAELPLTRHRPTYSSAAMQIDLHALGAKAGDTVRGFATAFDNHPGGARSADSATFEVRVLTADEYKELAREEYALLDLLAELERVNAEREKLDQLRDQLITTLEQLEASDGDPRNMEEQLQEYARQSQALADRMKERAEQMAIYSFEPAVQKQLKDAAQKMQARAEGASSAAAGLSDSTDSIDMALEQLQRDREKASGDEAVRQLTEQQLRQLEIADRLTAQADAVMNIAERQRELAERLGTYRDGAPLSSDESARLRQLGDEQDQLRRELTEALDRIEHAASEGAADLPKMSQSAAELVSKIREELAVERDQSDAAMHAQSSRGGYAHRSAESTATKLESLIGQCQGVGQCAADDLDGILGLTRSQIAAAMSELAGARRGRGMGSGAGHGIGSRGGTGSGGGTAGTQAGGASSRATLLGPHSRGGAATSTARFNLRTGAYNTQNGGFGKPAANAAERLEPQPASGDPARAAAAGPPGVPLQYRELAEQYFRRLAEDTGDNAK